MWLLDELTARYPETINTLKLTFNPKAVVLHWQETDKGGNYYLAITGRFEKTLELPATELQILGTQPVTKDNVKPCTPLEWPQLLKAASKYNYWTPETTFEEHLKQASLKFLETPEYEAWTFLTVFPTGLHYQNGTFHEHYERVNLDHDFVADHQPIYVFWAQMIRQGIALLYKQDPSNTIVKQAHKLTCFCDKEAVSSCVRCGWRVYCSKEHQQQDWKRHKKECRPTK